MTTILTLTPLQPSILSVYDPLTQRIFMSSFAIPLAPRFIQYLSLSHARHPISDGSATYL
jgi:hypothetical protein